MPDQRDEQNPNPYDEQYQKIHTDTNVLTVRHCSVSITRREGQYPRMRTGCHQTITPINLSIQMKYCPFCGGVLRT